MARPEIIRRHRKLAARSLFGRIQFFTIEPFSQACVSPIRNHWSGWSPWDAKKDKTDDMRWSEAKQLQPVLLRNVKRWNSTEACHNQMWSVSFRKRSKNLIHI